MNVNKTKHGDNHCSEQLDQMIQAAIQDWRPEYLSRRKDEIIDFIMANPDLPITYDQFVFLLRHSSPVVSPMRKDYFDVLVRFVSEAKALGDAQIVKSTYFSIPFYPDDQDNPKKLELYQSGIQYFLSLGINQTVGELYVHLAVMYGSIIERIQFCDKAMEFLDRTSKEYACVVSMREMLCHMEHQGNEEYYSYSAFGETIFKKGEGIFLSPIFSCSSFRKHEKSICHDILKGNMKWYESLTSFDSLGYDKEVVDENMSVGTSKYLIEGKELLRLPDETVICQADWKTYTCHVFSIRRVGYKDERMVGDMTETNYYARGIGPVRTVISVDGKRYVYDLCEYTVNGGDGLIPCCVGNQWCYRQKDCPDDIDQVIKREIIAQNGEEYLLSGWNYAGRNS